MAKPPFQREGGRIIEAQHQLSSARHRNAEEEHRAILEQAMERQISDESTQRSIFDRALRTQLRASASRRMIIDRALEKTRNIETEHRAILNRALSQQNHRKSLSQGLLGLSECRKANQSAREDSAGGNRHNSNDQRENSD